MYEVENILATAFRDTPEEFGPLWQQIWDKYNGVDSLHFHIYIREIITAFQAAGGKSKVVDGWRVGEFLNSILAEASKLDDWRRREHDQREAAQLALVEAIKYCDSIQYTVEMSPSFGDGDRLKFTCRRCGKLTRRTLLDFQSYIDKKGRGHCCGIKEREAERKQAWAQKGREIREAFDAGIYLLPQVISTAPIEEVCPEYSLSPECNRDCLCMACQDKILTNGKWRKRVFAEELWDLEKNPHYGYKLWRPDERAYFEGIIRWLDNTAM